MFSGDIEMEYWPEINQTKNKRACYSQWAPPPLSLNDSNGDNAGVTKISLLVPDVTSK